MISQITSNIVTLLLLLCSGFNYQSSSFRHSLSTSDSLNGEYLTLVSAKRRAPVAEAAAEYQHQEDPVHYETVSTYNVP